MVTPTKLLPEDCTGEKRDSGDRERHQSTYGSCAGRFPASFARGTLRFPATGSEAGKERNTSEQSSPWKALEKAMGGFKKELTPQDVLREKRQAQEFDDDDDGGGAGNRPGGGGDGSGDSEDEGLAGILDELLQVVLATLGIVFMYIYIIEGEEMTRLAKDYIKYLFGASKSVRLRRAMYKWGRFKKRVTRKKVVRNDWLERAILTTPTWWYDPRQLGRMQAQVTPSYE
ncbi:uncharacterized protein LOC131238962 [Magnolia sinica]|uniref:uncharacterized protein LOC131238962 n=1 Tax=Magnolia sinica TaxID=86752 RepID=UPI00265ACA85|nr:uncharacterized protein LOC131238962 [Magnolia sinica]